MEFAIGNKKRKLIIDGVREKLIQAIIVQDDAVKLDGLTTGELDEIIFEHIEDKNGDKKKVFALPLIVLKKIDMSNVSFDNFEAKEIDFSDFTGVKINPSKLYKKRCVSVNFDGVTFLDEFSDKYIEDCNFKGSKNAVIDADVVFGGKNVFSDVTFKSPIIKGYIGYSDFSGSKGAIIELGHMSIVSLDHCRLRDATIRGSFYDCSISGADFSGAHAVDGGTIKINPNEIRTIIETDKAYSMYDRRVKDISECNFDGVEFTEEFETSSFFKLWKTNFTGSRGVIIDPKTVYNNYYSYAVLNGVMFTPGSSITNAYLEETDFTGSRNAVISGLQSWMDRANLTDAKIEFDNVNFLLASPRIETATCDGELFCDVYKKTLDREFGDLVKKYTKKIDEALQGLRVKQEKDK